MDNGQWIVDNNLPPVSSFFIFTFLFRSAVSTLFTFHFSFFTSAGLLFSFHFRKDRLIWLM